MSDETCHRNDTHFTLFLENGDHLHPESYVEDTSPPNHCHNLDIDEVACGNVCGQGWYNITCTGLLLYLEFVPDMPVGLDTLSNTIDVVVRVNEVSKRMICRSL